MAKRRTEEPEIEVVEEVEGEDAATGSSTEQGLIIVTFLVLVTAMVTGLLELGWHYASGPFAR
jgi:hypothetical protein